MPPATASLSRLKSTSAKPGASSKARYSVLTPMRAEGGNAFSVLMKAGRSRGLATSTVWVPRLKNDSAPVSAKTWYSGSGITSVSAPSFMSRPIQAATCSTLATMLPWLSMAPLATPVVPPVYCRKARSSGPSATSSSASARPVASAARKGTAPGSRHGGTAFFTCLSTALVSSRCSGGSRSPACVVTTLRKAVAAITCSSVWAKFSSTTMATAPESFSWCCSSRGVYIGFTFTTTRPARRVPNSATGYCSRLGIISATRSPRRRPARFCSQAAKARLAASSWANVIPWPMEL